MLALFLTRLSCSCCRSTHCREAFMQNFAYANRTVSMLLGCEQVGEPSVLMQSRACTTDRPASLTSTECLQLHRTWCSGVRHWGCQSTNGLTAPAKGGCRPAPHCRRGSSPIKLDKRSEQERYAGRPHHSEVVDRHRLQHCCWAMQVAVHCTLVTGAGSPFCMHAYKLMN
jgi:hypothetical protein